MVHHRLHHHLHHIHALLHHRNLRIGVGRLALLPHHPSARAPHHPAALHHLIHHAHACLHFLPLLVHHLLAFLGCGGARHFLVQRLHLLHVFVHLTHLTTHIHRRPRLHGGGVGFRRRCFRVLCEGHASGKQCHGTNSHCERFLHLNLQGNGLNEWATYAGRANPSGSDAQGNLGVRERASKRAQPLLRITT